FDEISLACPRNPELSPKRKRRPRSCGRERPVLPQQRRKRRRRARRSFIDADWTLRDRARGRRNDTIWIPEAKRTQSPEAVAQSKYEPTDYRDKRAAIFAAA